MSCWALAFLAACHAHIFTPNLMYGIELNVALKCLSLSLPTSLNQRWFTAMWVSRPTKLVINVSYGVSGVSIQSNARNVRKATYVTDVTQLTERTQRPMRQATGPLTLRRLYLIY